MNLRLEHDVPARHERARGRYFLEHGGDLALGRSVDAGVGPAPLPAVQVCLAAVEMLEAEAAQRRFSSVKTLLMPGQERRVPAPRQRLGPLSEMAGFQPSTNGRF